MCLSPSLYCELLMDREISHPPPNHYHSEQDPSHVLHVSISHAPPVKLASIFIHIC